VQGHKAQGQGNGDLRQPEAQTKAGIELRYAARATGSQALTDEGDGLIPGPADTTP